jgi:malate dehydrogenase (oxaloacetate-decarboxylating)
MNINEEALKLHEENRGKIEVISKTEVKDMHDLAVVYTPYRSGSSSAGNGR